MIFSEEKVFIFKTFCLFYFASSQNVYYLCSVLMIQSRQIYEKRRLRTETSITKK
nr:MAG TPA: hypothetical protein [Caudoviricetes sp.]